MACSLKQTCVIEDVTSVRKYLFPVRDAGNEQQMKDNDADGWNEDDWANNWENDNEDNSKQKDENDSSDDQENNWFHKCQIAFSPTYDLLVIGYAGKIILLAAKSEGHSARSHGTRKYKIATQMEISEESGEHITSILCIPLVSLKKTSHGSVDWSCIVVGFSSGYIRMYTENGALLISQLLHESPVMEIKCRTLDHHSHKTGISTPDQPDEVTILYGDALVLLEGFSLFQTLRACRSQVALAAASGGMTIEPPPMSYKKWRLTSHQSPISSHISPGVLMPDPFNQMKTASILGGYSADIRNTAPAMSCFIATGTSPFTGFYYAVEGSTQPHLSHVALAVASKLKSALYSSASRWLAWGTGAQSEPTQKQKPKVELGTPLDIRCGMPDPLRYGDNIILAPGAHLSSSALAATTDSLGRVILMDVSRAIALRMWKGYRDAQIGFMRVFDDAHRSHRHHHHHSHVDNEHRSNIRRHALFLLIYAPRRGLLEVWTCINGPRVGAFNVSKNAKLLCPGHGMMGLNTSTMSSTVSHTFQCCLLEANGQVREIKIPFHLALSDANSKKARDMHLLKKLNLILHSKKRTGEEAVKILLEIRISGMLRQALEKLLHTRKIGADTFRSCITAIQQRLKEGGALKKSDSDLLKYCQEQINLIDLYEALQKLNESGMSSAATEKTVLEDVTNVDTMSELLHMTRTESTEALHSIACFHKSQHMPRVKFEGQEKPSLDVAEFLDCFSFQDNLSRKADDVSEPHVELRTTERTKSAKLAAFLFHSSLFGSTSPDDILFTLNGSIDLKPRIILELLFQHWLIQDTSIINGLTNCLRKLYDFIESCRKKSSNVSTPNSESIDTSLSSDIQSSEDSINLWEWIREDICASSHSTIAAYFLAIVARGVAIAANTQGDKEEKEDSDDGDGWEKMQKQEVDENSIADPPSYQESCTEQNTKPRNGDWETLWIDVEKWNLFIHQLEDSVLINTSIKLGKTKRRVSASKEDSKDNTTDDKTIEQSDDYVNEGVSVKDLLSNGPGYMAELVSHSICELDIPPRLLQKNVELDNITVSLTDPQRAFLDFLHQTLYVKFPYSLAPDCLHSHSFWELMVEWNKEPLEISKFITAIDHLRLVQEDPHSRHGLAVMSWRTFVTKRYAALAKLMDKVGKAPKDRLCRKEVGISDILMPSFCQACTDILQIIADAELDTIPKQVASNTSGISTGSEDPWQNVTGKRSIMDMGRAHAHAHHGLVQHNMHLSFIMHATMQFQLRGVKPLSGLFDRRGKSCFGLDLTTQDPSLPNPDTMEMPINKARQHFLTKVVSAAVQQLASHVHKKEEISSPLRLHMTDQECRLELEKWIETAVHMASEFHISSEKVKLHHVDELFKNGLDAIGLEASVTVSDKEVLSSSLVLIVGQRLSYILLHANPDDGVIMMSRMSTTLSTWIKSQDSTLLKKPDVDVSDTLKLSRTVLTMMSETNSLYNMALSLEEAASTMVNRFK
ncbi:rab3 GTPase-activating protein non-catalytic subunit-like isoform X2 [Styela clava]